MTEGIAFALSGQKVGEMTISDIVIKPRQRKIDIEDKEFIQHIEDLAKSIKRVGLLHPITLEDESNELIAGFCRIQAFLKLGHDKIPYVRRGDLDELQRKVMEAEENLQRLNLKWWEKAAAIAEIDEIQRKLHPDDWNTQKTAEMTGMSVGTVSQSKQLTEEMKLNPNIAKDNKTLVGALKSIKTKKQIEKRKETIALKKKGKLKAFSAKIIEGDALDLIKQQPDEEFDAVLTNFPFGIDLELKGGKKVYKDEEQYIVDLVRSMVVEIYRVLKDDSWFVGFFDMRKITYSNQMKRLVEIFLHNTERLSDEMDPEDYEYRQKLAAEALGLSFWAEQAGFDYVQVVPNVWVKPNKTQGIIGDPNKGQIVAYEAFIFAAKGNATLLKQGRQNIYIYDTPKTSERVHELQMSEELCTELVGMTCLGGSYILDPFAGSGMFGLGALNNQCEFLGFELDPEKASNGNMVLQEHEMADEEGDGDSE